MSCGDPNEADCREILDRVYEFLDSECDQRSTNYIAQHLDECAPCLQLFGIEREIKALVHRKCGGDPAPVGLRDRVRRQLQLVSGEDSQPGGSTIRTETTVVTETAVLAETAQHAEQIVQTTVVHRRVSGSSGTISS